VVSQDLMEHQDKEEKGENQDPQDEVDQLVQLDHVVNLASQDHKAQGVNQVHRASVVNPEQGENLVQQDSLVAQAKLALKDQEVKQGQVDLVALLGKEVNLVLEENPAPGEKLDRQERQVSFD
jgi:hypothetical protein